MRPAERSRALSAPAAERVECAVCARASAPELRACCWLEPAAAALVLPCAVPSSTALATAAVPGARGLATLSHTRSLLSRHCVCACRREPRRLARTHTVLYLANRLLLFNKGQSHAQQTTEYDMYPDYDRDVPSRVWPGSIDTSSPSPSSSPSPPGATGPIDALVLWTSPFSPAAAAG